MRKGEELKAPRYASAAVTRDYITTRDIIPTVLYISIVIPRLINASLSFISLREPLSLLNR